MNGTQNTQGLTQQQVTDLVDLLGGMKLDSEDPSRAVLFASHPDADYHFSGTVTPRTSTFTVTVSSGKSFDKVLTPGLKHALKLEGFDFMGRSCDCALFRKN